MNFGNVLKGATMLKSVLLNSTNANPDLHHTTMVNVTAKGGNPIVDVGRADLNVTPTMVDRNGVPLTVTGTFNTYGTLKSLKNALSVTTAEASGMAHTKPYSDLNVSYSVNVGLAKLGSVKDSFNGAMVLWALVRERVTHVSGLIFQGDPGGNPRRGYDLVLGRHTSHL